MSDTEDFTLPEEELSEGSPCPYCGSQLVLRHSDHGDFLGCTNYPDCSYLKPVSVSHSITVLGDVGAPCPVCGEPLQVKKGRFGIFIGCSNYPECTFVHNTQEQLDIDCPICKKGKIAKRQNRSGRNFYACSNYPDCTFSVPGKPVQRICESCAFPLMFEKKFKAGIGLVCANPLCESKNKRKRLIIRPF